MFNKYLFRVAKNHVIMIAEKYGDISPEIAKEMAQISGNQMNIEYGVLLHKSKVATNRYAAAAAVFARLAAHSRLKQRGAVSSRDWESATFHAMVKSGANIGEASEITDFLVAKAYAELIQSEQRFNSYT